VKDRNKKFYVSHCEQKGGREKCNEFETEAFKFNLQAAERSAFINVTNSDLHIASLNHYYRVLFPLTAFET
jgi:hypothetical protein